ncbi:MAG: sigma-70 family RNA polymerase sigma factor [Acidobacteriota bacterium]|nr:sigma-70 family RNA polymerase sigma factor [Acidobacteriota bacterium]
MENSTGGPDERELLRRAREGEPSALREIIERHERLVAATVTGILGPAPEVDDIGQETFIRFFRAMERFRGEARIGTYLVRIAINLSFNELKRRRRDRQAVREAEGPQDECRSMEAKAIVRQALGRLEPRFRQVVVLRLIDGYSVRETADILRLPQGTVLSRLSRGQDRLKAIVDGLAAAECGSRERRIL